MDFQGSADDDEDVGWSKCGYTYLRDDFPTVEDWLYCKKMVDLVWVNEMEDEDFSETEEPEARVLRRTEQKKCIPAARYKCDGDEKYFIWERSTFKVKVGGQINIRRVGDDCPWKHHLYVTRKQGNRLDVHPESELPEEAETGSWQIELTTNTLQRDRLIGAIYTFSTQSTMRKKVMHDKSLTCAQRTEANHLTPMVPPNVSTSLLFRAET